MLTDYLVPRNCCSPFDLRRGWNRLFSEMAPELRGAWPFGSADFGPASNVWETPDDYYVETAAPGLSQDDVSLSMVGSELTIRLESPTVGETEREGRFWRRERARSESTFSLTFPTAVDAQGVVADLDNGVLVVRVPKAEKAQVKKICVNKSTRVCADGSKSAKCCEKAEQTDARSGERSDEQARERSAKGCCGSSCETQNA